MTLTSIPLYGFLDMGMGNLLSMDGLDCSWGWGFSALTAEAPLLISAVSLP